MGGGVADPGKAFEDRPEILAMVGAERSGHVFKNSESWVSSMGRFPHFLDDTDDFEKQHAPFSGKPGPLARYAQVLTRAAEGNAFHWLDLPAVYFGDVS